MALGMGGFGCEDGKIGGGMLESHVSRHLAHSIIRKIPLAHYKRDVID